MNELIKEIFTPQLVMLASIFVFIILSIIFIVRGEQKEYTENLRSEMILIKGQFLKLIDKINKQINNDYRINESYNKQELISILQCVDNELMLSDNVSKGDIEKLTNNRDLVTGKFLDWCRINSLSDSIITLYLRFNDVQSKLTGDYNSAISKCVYIRQKYPAIASTHLEFITEREYYQKKYFDKLKELAQMSYRSLASGNFIKAFTIKHNYDDFLEEVQKMLKEPSNLLQIIHDSNYQVSLLEQDISNHTKGSRFVNILLKSKNHDIKPVTLEKLHVLKSKREKYLLMDKWHPDQIKKVNMLKILKMEMITLDNEMDKDINDKRLLRLDLSRAVNQLVAIKKAEDEKADLKIFSDIFN